MKLTDQQIVDITNNKGHFYVDWRWRNDRLRKQCQRLAKQGKIKFQKSQKGVDAFIPVNPNYKVQ